MKTFGVFALLLSLAVARGEATSNKLNQLEIKNTHQATNPTGLGTASTRTQNLQITPSQYQSNHIGDDAVQLSQQSQQFSNRDETRYHDQNQAYQFHSQDLPQQFRNQDIAEQFRHQNQEFIENQVIQSHNLGKAQQFHNQAQQLDNHNQAQQFHNQAQQLNNHNQAQRFINQNQAQQYHSHSQITTGSPVRQDQEISNILQSQQQMNPSDVSMIHSQSKEQMLDISAEQQLYSGSLHPQQRFQQDRSVRNVQDQQNERRFDDSSSQQRSPFDGIRSTEIRVLPQSYSTISAFEKGHQPIVLPGVSHAHSASVVVPGLKNLPSLPALVYSSGPVPTSPQVLAYSRPWHQGGAFVRQHWQTPFARYVYSHIL